MSSTNTSLPCLLTAMALLVGACGAEVRSDQAVLIGGSADEDACGGSGMVRGDLENVSVRSGPTANAGKLDQLKGGAIVWFCDEAPGWVGVVYRTEADEECGVATPVAVSTPYVGPCKAGWIESAKLTLLAG